MALTGKSLIVPLAAVIACAMPVLAGGKERAKFDPGPASNYETRLTISKVTIAAVPYIQHAQVEQAFGKLDPNHEGVLPVLVIIQNDTNQSITLDQMKVEIGHGGSRPHRRHSGCGLEVSCRPRTAKSFQQSDPARIRKEETAGGVGNRRVVLSPPACSRQKSPASGFFYFRAPYRGGSTFMSRACARRLRVKSCSISISRWIRPINRRDAASAEKVKSQGCFGQTRGRQGKPGDSSEPCRPRRHPRA